MKPVESPSLPPPLPVEEKFARKGAFAVIGQFFDYVFGLLVILTSLAVISAIPVIHLLSLGYLLEASARVAKSGRIRDGVIGLEPAARIGKIVVAAWLIFLPVRVLHGYWLDANIIDQGTNEAKSLGVVLLLISCVSLFCIGWAIARGGKFRHFLWLAPVRFLRRMGQPWNWKGALQGITDLRKGLRLLDFFQLGFFGFLGGALWLAIPVLILFSAPFVPSQPGSLLISMIGAGMLGIVILYLPFIQTRYAVERKFVVFGQWKTIREQFRKAPLALWTALFVTLLFAMPLYLLKIELAPQEVAWIPNLVFVVFMFPARLVLGWAASRSAKRETYRHWFFRWTARLGMIPPVLVYVFVVWLTQYLSWHGSYSLLEQHAFLLPAPMLGL
ncbi:MAG: hypothetical protein P1V20_27250 [Verrucomicrobiales bacterium]|nr:hypothetical protein [Verrucomicrobiales bacterium]